MAMSSPRRALALLALLCAAGATTLAGFAGPADAAGRSDITWSVAPADAKGPDGRRVIDVELAGGQEVTEHVAVINRSTEEVVFAIDANDGYLTAKGLFDMRPSDATPTDGGAWIKIPDKVTIPAGATAIVPVKISAPPNATPGDHPAGVTASVDTVSKQVRVQNRVGVRVNLRVTGDYVAKVAVTGLRAEYTGSWNPFAAGSIDVTYTVANVGNVRVAPDSQVRTSALVGESGWDDPSEAKAREIMPGSSREFTARVTGVWPMGSLTTEVMAIPSPVGNSPSGVVAQQVAIDTTLWALPWPQLVFLVLLVAVFLVVRVAVSRRRKRLKRQAEILREANELIAKYGGKPKD
ncbi:DUF916 domain-containing protein [Streptosporangium sp. 'caverna']|uniref:COG1470 family protein n=1 Tax=Streptosporangium sp. 'caverna' TaxID=2202249 RepID=UPI0013A6DDDA|nr:DUF916 domain-containing protein [Streptosporangium sp. 'caverna']